MTIEFIQKALVFQLFSEPTWIKWALPNQRHAQLEADCSSATSKIVLEALNALGMNLGVFGKGVRARLFSFDPTDTTCCPNQQGYVRYPGSNTIAIVGFCSTNCVRKAIGSVWSNLRMSYSTV